VYDFLLFFTIGQEKDSEGRGGEERLTEELFVVEKTTA
jgi:hypothetical protein